MGKQVRRSDKSDVSPVSSSNVGRMDWWSWIGIGVVSFLASFLLYGQSLQGEFVYDDVIILGRKDLKSVESLFTTVWTQRTTQSEQANEGYRPLSMVSFGIQFLLWGDNPRPFHIYNIVLHALNTIAVFALVQVLYKKKLLSWITALLFLFLPIHSENVSAIKYREDMQSSLFMILSWIAFLKGNADRAWRSVLWYGASAFLYLANLLSKELLLLSPLFIGIVWLTQLPRGWRSIGKSILVCSAVFGLTLAAYLSLRMWIYGVSGVSLTVTQQLFNPLVGHNFMTHISTTGKIFFTYVTKTIVPYHLSANYGFNHFPVVQYPWAAWESLAGFVLFGVFIYCAIRYRNTPLGVGTVLFLVSYTILSKLLLQSADIFAERWMYFPSIGIVLPIASFITFLYKKYHYVVLVSLLLVLSAYSIVIVSRVPIWKSSLTLYESMVKDAPNSAWAHFSMGNYYLGVKRVDDAERHARISLAILPDLYESLELMGEISGYRSDYETAKSYFQQAIRVNPDKNVAHLNYALSLTKQQRYTESLQYVSKEFLENPRDPKLRYVMALNFYKMGEWEKAKYFFDWDMKKSFEQKVQELEAF